MGTTAQKLQAIINSKAGIKDAIEAKGQTVGNIPLSGYADKILAIETGEDDGYRNNDVRFVDFDGKQLFDFTKEEFLELEALPTNTASHENLTNNGWNWTLAGAQAYVRKYGKCLIGAQYTVTDGASRITIEIDDTRLLTVPLVVKQSKSEGTLVSWGDGTSERFVATDINTTHTYAQLGEYTITLLPDNDCDLTLCTSARNSIFGNANMSVAAAYAYIQKRILVGRVSSNTYAPFITRKVKEIVLGSVIINFFNQQSCDSLKALVLPYGITTVPVFFIADGTFIKELSLPEGLTTIPQSSFANFTSVRDVVIPEAVTTYATGNFSACKQTRSIILPDNITTLYSFNGPWMAEKIHIPSGVTSLNINSMFNGCRALQELVIPDSVTIIGASAFNDAWRIKEIIIPSSVQSVGSYSFGYALLVEKIIFREGVVTIGMASFWFAQSIRVVDIASTVTSIGNEAFRRNTELQTMPEAVYYIRATTPPTLGTNVFTTHSSIPMRIIVPQGTLNTYKTATNWAAYSDYMEESNEF